jgi:hypothetical protein
MQSITRPINSLTKVHSYSDNHYISKCTIADLLQAKVANWEHNRPPDLLRCGEIAEHIYSRRPILDWMLYMTYDDAKKTFYVVDGIHRFTALQIIYKENHKPHDYITPSSFGGNGDADWLYQEYILICIRRNPTKGETIDWFQTLNKSNPVPDLYIVNTAEEKRKIIEEVAQEWIRIFKPHFSASQKPNIPNINRDRFIDLLDGTYEKHCIKSVQDLNELLYELNNSIRENIPPKTSQNAIDKCSQSGCFLFLLSKDVLLERI